MKCGLDSRCWEASRRTDQHDWQRSLLLGDSLGYALILVSVRRWVALLQHRTAQLFSVCMLKTLSLGLQNSLVQMLPPLLRHSIEINQLSRRLWFHNCIAQKPCLASSAFPSVAMLYSNYLLSTENKVQSHVILMVTVLTVSYSSDASIDTISC